MTNYARSPDPGRPHLAANTRPLTYLPRARNHIAVYVIAEWAWRETADSVRPCVRVCARGLGMLKVQMVMNTW